MSVFPKRESDLLALSEQMIVGFTSNAEQFPGGDADALQAALDVVKSRKAEQVEGRAAAKVATEAKAEAIDTLRTLMKRQLKQAEVDVKDNEQLMELIGWNSEREISAPRVPAQPDDLQVLKQGQGAITLTWGLPRQEGGYVRAYIVERRDQLIGGGEAAFSPWRQVDTSLERTVALTDQPRGTVLEYRVIAINKAGDSSATNTVEVTL